MHLLVLILTHIGGIDSLLHELAENGVSGCTIIDAKGMKSVIEHYADLPMFGLLRHLMEEDDEREENKMLLFVLEDAEIEPTKQTIHEIIGDLDSPNTGIMFTLPIDSVEGVGGGHAAK